MNFSDMYAAISEAKHTIEAADGQVGRMARLCAGRLRLADVSDVTLSALKRELADWDMHRKCWKEKR